MTRRRAEFLAWGLWSSSMLVLVLVNTPLIHDSNEGFSVDDLLIGLPFLLFATVGAIVASRRPDNRLGWLYLAIGLLAAFTSIGGALEYAHYPPSGPGRVALVLLYAVTNLAWYPTLGLLATLSILWFPDGRPPSPRWRWVEILVAVGIAGVTISFALVPGPISGRGTPDNPIGIPGAADVLAAINLAFGAAFFVSISASVASFVVRFRRSRGIERQQLKWFLVGALALGAGIVISIAFNTTGNVVFGLSTSAVPLAAGIAISRYHLYDLDRLISRAVAYLAVSALLVAVYAGIVVGIGALTGSTDSPVLIAGATLAVAALVRPVLLRVRAAIDRRFYRGRYDAQQALEAFAASLRDEVALEQVRAHLLGAVRETMQPAQASVWLRGGAR